MKVFTNKLNIVLFYFLALSGTVAAQNTESLTISRLVEQIIQGVDPDENSVIPPNLADPQHDIPSISDKILKSVKGYLKGDHNFEDLGEITASNCHHFLSAAKLIDLNNNDSFSMSTFPVRLACLVNSGGQIKSLEAFSYRLNPTFFSEYDHEGNYLPNKKHELYYAGKFELVFIPEWISIQKKIIFHVVETVQSFSEQLDYDSPHFILFTGNYGAGKSYQTKKHHWVDQIEYDPEALFSGVMSSDSIKRIYMSLVEGSTNSQVHHEGVALRLQIMVSLLQNLPNISLLQEQCLATTSSIDQLLDLARENNAKVKLVDVDTYLETSCLRILTRDLSNGDSIPTFRAIVAQQKNICEARAHLLRRVKEDQNIEGYELLFSDGNETYLVAEKKNNEFIILPGMEELYHQSLSPTESSIIEALSKQVVTYENCEHYGSQLRQFLGMTIEEALRELSKK